MNSSEPNVVDLAFALSLNRAKPSHLSVREFILELRKHIYPGSRPQFSGTYEESQRNYINAAFYFESRSREAEKQNECLLDKIQGLERQIKQLNQTTANEQGGASKPKKRKRRSSDRRDCLSIDDIETCIDQVAEKFQVVEGNENYRSLLSRIYELQTALQENRLNDTNLADCIRKVCSSFNQLLAATTDRSSGIPEPDITARGLPAVLCLIFSALNNKFLSSPDQQPIQPTAECHTASTNSIIYNILTTFSAILDRIHHSADQASTELRTSSPPGHFPNHLKLVARTFITLLLNQHRTAQNAQNEKTKKVYSDLLEGTAHLLLTQLGRTIYTLTFQTRQPNSLDKEIRSTTDDTIPNDLVGPSENSTHVTRKQLPFPTVKDKPHDTDNAASPNANVNSIVVARLEAGILIPLLELVVPVISPSPVLPRGSGSSGEGRTHRRKRNEKGNGTVQTPSGLASENHTSRDCLTSVETSPMLQKPLRILQNTLVQGIFGTTGTDVGENVGQSEYGVGETLKTLGDLAGTGGDQRSGDEDFDEEMEEDLRDGEEWAVRRAWELIGWDVLAEGFGSGSEGTYS